MENLKLTFEKSISSITTMEELSKLKSTYLGKKGLLKEFQHKTSFDAMNPNEKRRYGKRFNDIKSHMAKSIAEKQKTLEDKNLIKTIDLTLPSIRNQKGRLHPISAIRIELEDICSSMGFMILNGKEVETDYNNFQSLNTPKDHPARDMQDTFWLSNGKLLRTQTSANQVQAMKQWGAPLRAVFLGKCFRYETMDTTHETTFYQMEGIVVDRNISIANVIAVMKEILSAVFHHNVEVRLRPGYFPFVEPAFELDIKCLICGGTGCKGCKNAGWLELLPCGLIHPVVLKNGGIDTEIYNGFAFGLGLTRLVMMRYQIPDIRYFNSGDYRFLQQF